ncbi:hypothetical protein [Granulicoccus phenolivorans]|uniref:hypothetical protein n=1 Tax=Granulicoccus phenolivorans TaxID=266854 RepID=UPI0003F9BC02|nr:hypothetical protein [Granulicoccus phenolivorans]
MGKQDRAQALASLEVVKDQMEPELYALLRARTLAGPARPTGARRQRVAWVVGVLGVVLVVVVVVVGLLGR